MSLCFRFIASAVGFTLLGTSFLLFAAYRRQAESEIRSSEAALEARELSDSFARQMSGVVDSETFDALGLSNAQLLAFADRLESKNEDVGDSVAFWASLAGVAALILVVLLVCREKRSWNRDLERVRAGLLDENPVALLGAVECERSEFRDLLELIRIRLATFEGWLDKLNNERTEAFSELERVRHAFLGKLQVKSESTNRAMALSVKKGDFLAVMSHEIRTPMNGVLGIADDMLSYNLEDDLREKVEMIKLSGESLVRILDDILDFSKIEAGKLGIKLRSFDFSFACRVTYSLFKSRANEKGLAYNLIVGEDVPQFLLGDSVRVRQVLANLISNALKFTDEGGVTVSVALEKREVDGVLLAVSDSGMGIDPEQFDRLFEAFSQGESGLEETGTGLGLAISKRLAELMDGELSYAANVPNGSIFKFWFPYYEGVPVESQDEWPRTVKRVENARVLVVEDNRINQQVLESLLERANHRVQVAANGLEALEKIEVSVFDVVFMDCMMPKLDGFEAARRIRSLPEGHSNRGVPIVALTANAFAHDRDLCFQSGMNDFLAKPVKKETLLGVVDFYCQPGRDAALKRQDASLL